MCKSSSGKRGQGTRIDSFGAESRTSGGELSLSLRYEALERLLIDKKPGQKMLEITIV